MQHQGTLAVSGHVLCIKRKRGSQWYVKYRLEPKQIQKRLGPAWQDVGQPPPGYFTRKTAEASLAAILTDARRGSIPAPRKPASLFVRRPRNGFGIPNGSVAFAPRRSASTAQWSRRTSFPGSASSRSRP
jgi:hypothetical protein